MMSIMEHLDELKKRMIRVFLLALVLSIISLFFYKQIFDFFIVNIESIIQDNGGVIAIQRITEGWVVAAKLAITFGVVGVINMAHGELIMLGAYCAYVVQQIIPNNISASIIISLPVAFVFTGLVGILIERLIVKNLYGRPLETLLATFGLSLILQQIVRSIFSPLNKTVHYGKREYAILRVEIRQNRVWKTRLVIPPWLFYYS